MTDNDPAVEITAEAIESWFSKAMGYPTKPPTEMDLRVAATVVAALRTPEGARALHRFTDDELALLAQVTKDAESWSWDAESTWHGILAKIGAQPREDPNQGGLR